MKDFHLQNDSTLRDLTEAEPTRVVISVAGGNAFEAFAMSEWLEKHPDVTVHIEGLCGGAAVLLVASAGRATICRRGRIAFKRHSMVTEGDRDSLRQSAALLQKMDDAFARSVAARSDFSEQQVREWMRDSSFVTPEMALGGGLVDEIVEGEWGIGGLRERHDREAARQRAEKVRRHFLDPAARPKYVFPIRGDETPYLEALSDVGLEAEYAPPETVEIDGRTYWGNYGRIEVQRPGKDGGDA